MSRPLRVAGYLGLGVIGGLLVAVLAVSLLTRSEWGMERARLFIVGWLDERVDGELRLGRITGPGLLGGAIIHDFGIVDPRGRPFLSSDSLEIAYDWRTLLSGRILLNRIVLYNPIVVIEKLPGDTAWNYEYVFPDPSPGDVPGDRSLIMFNDARIVNGTATVRLPIDTAAITGPADTARMIVDVVPGGMARAMVFEQIDARLDRVIWESPIEPGRLFDVRSLRTNGHVWREPFSLRDARGTLTMRDSIVTFDMPEVELPGSRAAVLGRVVIGRERNMVDVRVDGDRMLFRDMQWLYPGLPEEGGGSLVLRIQSQQDGTLFLAEDARLSAPGTRVAGTFGVVMAGDSIYFTRVNLRASPLDVRLIEQILPGGLPVDGLLVGTVEVSGPLSALETKGDIQLARRPGTRMGGSGGQFAGQGAGQSAGQGAGQSAGQGAADVSWRGVLDMRGARTGQVAARSFHADVRQLELALLSAFNGGRTLDGSVTGKVDASGRLDLLSFTTSFEHASSAGELSIFDGSGTITGHGSARVIDLLINATPVTLRELAGYVPALRGLQGDLTGPVHLTGTSDNLGFRAQLASAAGALDMEGQVLRTPAGRRVTATARADNFELHRLRTELPPITVTGGLRVDVTGDQIETATGSIELLLDSARLGSMPNASVAVFGELSDGILVIDSSLVRSVLGVARGRGTLALVPDREGTLEIALNSETLEPLQAYVFGDVAADAEPRIAGSVEGSISITGWLHAFGLHATARGRGLVFGSATAESVLVEAGLDGLGGSAASLRVTATADSMSVWSHPVPVARLEIAGRTDSLHAVLSAADDTRETFLGRADLERTGRDLTRLRLYELRIGGDSPWNLARPAAITLTGHTAHVDTIDLRHGAAGRIIAAGRLGWVDRDPDVAHPAVATPAVATPVVAIPAVANPAVANPEMTALDNPAHRAATESLAAEASLANQGVAPLDFTVRLADVPFVELLRAARSAESGAGEVEGGLRLYGTALDPLLEGEITARDVVYGDVRIDRAFAEVSYAALGLDAHAEAQYGGRSFLTGGGRIPVDLRLAPVAERRTNDPLRFTISADSLPPGLPLGLLDGFANVGGRIDGRVTVAGTSLDPALSGAFTLRNGTADWDVSGVRYRDVNGSFTLEGDRLLRIDMRAFAGDPRVRGMRALTGAAGGSGSIVGTLDFADLTDPRFDLRFSANRAYAARRRDMEASVTGTILLGGRYSRPEVSGSVRVDEAALYLDELYRQYLIVGLELSDPRLLSLVDTSLVAVRPLLAASTNPFLRGLRVRNLQLAVAADSWLRSRDMDVEVTGDLTVAFDRGDDRRDEDLRLSGSLNIERGTYTLYYPPFQSRRFQVRGGTIDFPGTPGIDPNLAITAAYRARAQGEPLDVLAVVAGTLQNPRVRLSSDAQPPISESDLASYLFFGIPTWEVANTSAGTGDARAVAGLGVRALGPSVLGYASSGLQTLVQSAGIFDYVGLTAAELAPADQTAGGLSRVLAGTQLELGRYLSSSLFFGYTQRLGSGTYDPAVRLEWRFLPEHSFELFAEDRFARTPGFGARTETGLRKIYGFSLFREWGF